MAGEFTLRSLLKSSLLYGLSDILLKLIGFFLVPIYTRVMLPEQYGVVGYTNAVTQVLTPVLGLGIVNCLPMLFFSHQDEARRRLVSTAINAVLGFGLLLALTLTFFGGPLFALVAPDVPFAPYLVITIWVSLFAGFNLLPLGLFNIQNRPAAYLAFSVGLALLNVVSALVFVVGMKLGALGVLYALLVSSGVGLLIALFILRRSYLPVIDRKLLASLLALSLPVLPHLLSGTLARFVDRILLANLSTLATTGMYSLALVLASPVTVIMGAAFAALGPMYYKRAAQDDPALAEDWSRLGTLYFLVGALAALGLSIFSGEVLALFAPGQYGDARLLVPLLAVSQLVLGLYWLATPAIGHARKTWIYPVASTVTLAIGVICNLLLIPVLGAAGAAWATLASGLVQLGLFFAYSQRCLRVRYDYRAIGLIALLCYAAFLACSHWWPEGGIVWRVIGIKLLVLLGAALAALLVAVPASRCLTVLQGVMRGYRIRD
ncbi:MAG: polysaccharide biosynthesis protein [Proteobacteria bacterium]|nr:polysaccharide biosynthesis protein [Pseudomonadota bacterium]